MQLILVRHGISADNVGNIISGGKSNPDLSQKESPKLKRLANLSILKKLMQYIPVHYLELMKLRKSSLISKRKFTLILD